MNNEQLEALAQELCDTFEIYAPPVPVELMLRQPKENMWDEVDPSQLSGTFMNLSERFSPRMSLARLLVRHITMSEWGKQHNLPAVIVDKESINNFARKILMPREMVEGLTASMRNPTTMSTHFEVPESDAEERLLEMS